MDNTIKFGYIAEPVYVEQKPYIDDEGFYMPCERYVREGYESLYYMALSKEQFIKMYNKWIKGE